ncbi:MAG TPA: endonuclease III, partial [bacterium]|nr:endonuclease III [bacterium]
GIGRKSANIILGITYGLATGIAVDTHVGRIARRLGLTNQKDADKVEEDLLKLLPQSEWRSVNLTWVLHGRETCQARKPQCGECVVKEFCDRIGVTV